MLLLLSFLFLSDCLEHEAGHDLCQLSFKISTLFRLYHTTQSELRCGRFYAQSEFSVGNTALSVVVLRPFSPLALFEVKVLLKASFDLDSDCAPFSSAGIHLLQLRKETFT